MAKIKVSEDATARFNIFVEAVESRLAQSLLQKNGEPVGPQVTVSVIQCRNMETGEEVPVIVATRTDDEKTEVCPVAVLLEGSTQEIGKKYRPSDGEGNTFEPDPKDDTSEARPTLH